MQTEHFSFKIVSYGCAILSYFILQYNFKKQNETAVRDEMVEMANLLDGVRF